jgi:hypothetical protein
MEVDESYSAVNMMRFRTLVMLVSPELIISDKQGGHNLICIGGIAAALGAVEKLKEHPNQAGEVVLLGTPAEEGSCSSDRRVDFIANAENRRWREILPPRWWRFQECHGEFNVTSEHR